MIGTAQTPSVLDAAAGDLVLRISGAGRSGQIVRLRSRECTVGSAPNCTLRIRARGVGPVHCAILRGDGAAIIEQRDSGTRLNGQPFESAPLTAGDRFAVGPLELEVLDTGMSAGRSSTQPSARQSESRIEEEAELRGAEWRARERQCEALRHELAEVQSRLKTQESEIEAREKELDARAMELEARLAEAGQHQQEAECRSSELETLRQELTEAQSRLKAQEAEIAERESDLETRAAEIVTRQKNFDAQCVQLEAMQKALDTSQSESDVREAERQRRDEASKLWARELDCRQAELEAASRQLESDRKAFQEEYARWQQERTAACDLSQEPEPDPDAREGSPAEEPSSGSSIQSIEILRRLGFSVPGDDESPDESPDLRRSPPGDTGLDSVRSSNLHAGAALADAQPEAPSESPHHEEESIDQYMARLLERMRNPASSSQGPAAPPQTQEAGRVEVPNAETPPEGDSLPAEEPLRALTPRAVAPERTIDLSAMRELANFSASAAIERHTRGRLVRASGGKFLVAVVGAVCGGLLLWRAVSLNGSPLTLFSAAASFIIALYWSLQYLILTGKIIAIRPAADPGSERSEAKSPGR